jgi:hypothetical protein
LDYIYNNYWNDDPLGHNTSQLAQLMHCQTNQIVKARLAHHGAGIYIYIYHIFTPFLWPSFVGFYIPAPWLPCFAYGKAPSFWSPPAFGILPISKTIPQTHHLPVNWQSKWTDCWDESQISQSIPKNFSH